jgi:hypothetical protein
VCVCLCWHLIKYSIKFTISLSVNGNGRLPIDTVNLVSIEATMTRHDATAWHGLSGQAGEGRRISNKLVNPPSILSCILIYVRFQGEMITLEGNCQRTFSVSSSGLGCGIDADSSRWLKMERMSSPFMRIPRSR